MENERDAKMFGTACIVTDRGSTMPIRKLDHYSIRTLAIDAFFEDPSQVTIELSFPASEAQRAA